jgi:peptidyl-prolyl cis-trans isomerase-like 4
LLVTFSPQPLLFNDTIVQLKSLSAMALLLETTLGDLVIDLDVEGSPALCKNVLKLAKARYYTSTLIYNVQPKRFCQLGDPRGDGTGGACIYGLLEAHESNSKDVLTSRRRFLKSHMGRPLTTAECRERGRVVATEMNGIADTIGSQLIITIDQGVGKALDGFSNKVVTKNISHAEHESQHQQQHQQHGTQVFRSVGRVVEDDNQVLDQIASSYCDANGRPYADLRVVRALVIDDPFDDPPGMDELLESRGVVRGTPKAATSTSDFIAASPDYERPPEEEVEIRIQADQIDTSMEEDQEKMKQRDEDDLRREDKSRAVVLEMLGDLPSADTTAPENVLFVCKLNPVTEDEDLELIFSRFDERVKAEIIRDPDTGNSLQYAFVEFSEKEQAVEAYFKMNNALVDDRRIKVDFSQSVAKVWDRFNQRARHPHPLLGMSTYNSNTNHRLPKDPNSQLNWHRWEPRPSDCKGETSRRNLESQNDRARRETTHTRTRDNGYGRTNDSRRDVKIEEKDKKDIDRHHDDTREHKMHRKHQSDHRPQKETGSKRRRGNSNDRSCSISR